jgi:hypothetical protein
VKAPGNGGSSGWQQLVPRAIAAGAVLTVLCCIGLSVATGLVSAAGAAFLLRDATLRPLLLAVLAATVVSSVLTFRRHRNVFPVLLTTLAGGTLYWLIFGHGQAHGDHMGDAMPNSAHNALTGASRPPVWAAIAVLIGAQVWDLIATSRCRAAARRSTTTDVRP